MKKIIIKSLNIINWRSLKDIKISFNEGQNIISGKNGTGKSSILDLIRYMIFQKNYEFKTEGNIKSINDNNSDPNVEMILSLDNEEIKLSTKDKTWFVNNIKQSDKESYRKTIADKLKLNSIDDIFNNVNPHLFIDIFEGSGKSENSKKSRNIIMKILNNKLPSGQKIDSNELEEIFEEIESLESERKDIRKLINNIEKEIETFKKSHTEIINWNKANHNADETRLNNLENEKSKYISLINEKEYISVEINKKNNKLDNLRNKNINKNKKESKFKIFILSILTLGLYLIFRKKKNTSKNELSPYENEQSIKETEKELEKLKNQWNKLREKIEEIDIDKINQEISEINEKELEIQEHSRTKDILYNKLEEKNNYEEQLEELKSKITKLNSKKISISQNIEKMIKDNFKTFDISLFDEKGKEKISISQNNIDLEYLNHANKLKVIYEINEFIKSDALNTFSLIDQGESFNELNINSSQSIIAKVDNDELKINGKYIH